MADIRMFRRLLTDRRVMIFLAAGLLNTSFGFAVYSGLVALSVQPGHAVTLATLVGIVFNFTTSRLMVFREAQGAAVARFAGFVLVYGLIYGLNQAVLALLIHLGTGPYAGQALFLPLGVVLSYLLQRFLVFRVVAPS